MATSLNIKLENFEGPFDILLHLIKKNEMDIYNVRIIDITNQYIDYINEMKEMDLELTSEFIVMAATLLEIKSSQLLPNDKNDETAITEEEDPNAILIEKLVKYKRYKSAALFLKGREQCNGLTYSKKGEIIEDGEIDLNEVFKNTSFVDLYNTYSNLINKYNNKKNVSNIIEKEIPVELFTIEDKMHEVLNFIKLNKKINFFNIRKSCNSKIEVIITFLAILELIKLRNIKVNQDRNFEDIIIERID